jgi:large subunit ribosomal protein L6
MSRKAKLPIELPKGVEVKAEGSKITVKGPKGSLVQELQKGIKTGVKDGKLHVELEKEGATESKFLGLSWALLANMVKGVSSGFEKRLEMIGVGYRAAVQGKLLDLQIGLSHPTKVTIPQGVTVAVDKNTLIIITGIDNQLVGQFAADVRAKRKPEPYQGKGIRYVGEYVRKKAGKAGKK